MYANRNKRGIVLGIVAFTCLILGSFIFAYHRMVIQQNRMAHREQLGEITGRLALNGVNMLAEFINSGTGADAAIRGCAPRLFEPGSINPDKTVDGLSVTGGGATSIDKVLNDFNLYLSQLSNLDNPYGTAPVCEKMAIEFEDVEAISPGISPAEKRAGRDPIEKTGEAVLSCLVEFGKMRREAKIRRQFKVVSMVPGPFARFTLFVPYTPDTDSYNAVGVMYNGNYDPTYSHTIPSVETYKSLRVYNGTYSYSLGTTPDPQADLSQRGWIYLGKSRNPAVSGGAVTLKIPSGYNNSSPVSNSACGGHFMFSMPTTSVGGSLIVPYDVLKEGVPPLFLLDNSPLFKCEIRGLHQGFYTYDPNKAPNEKLGAGSAGFWSGVTTNAATDRFLCASSWLMPYGDKDKPSRTLIVGNILAGFLKVYGIKDLINPETPKPPNYSGGITSKRRLATDPGTAPVYNCTDKIESKPNAPKYEEVFLEPTTTEKGYDSFKRVMPRNYSSTVPSAGGVSPVAFNAMFDSMMYPGAIPGVTWTFPPYGQAGYVPLIDRNASVKDPFYVPKWDQMSASTIPGLHPSDLKIMFSPTGGAVDDNYYLDGDLEEFTIPPFSDPVPPPNPLKSKVTHIVDLSAATSLAQENGLLKSLVFATKDQSTFTSPVHPSATAGSWYVPKQPGIFFIKRRRSGGVPASDILSLPGRIYLTTSWILIQEKGSLSIPTTILSPLKDGAPEHLFSIVVLDGDIVLNDSKEIDAYLVALKKGLGSPSPGGRLLSGGGTSTMNIFGGLAIWEMGLYSSAAVSTTMSNFPNGGQITYNPRFNPSLQFHYDASRKLIMEDKASSIVVEGGG